MSSINDNPSAYCDHGFYLPARCDGCELEGLRERLPAALAEIERLQAELRAHKGFLTADTARVSVSEVLSAQLVARENERDRLAARVAEMEAALERLKPCAHFCLPPCPHTRAYETLAPKNRSSSDE